MKLVSIAVSRQIDIFFRFQRQSHGCFSPRKRRKSRNLRPRKSTTDGREKCDRISDHATFIELGQNRKSHVVEVLVGHHTQTHRQSRRSLQQKSQPSLFVLSGLGVLDSRALGRVATFSREDLDDFPSTLEIRTTAGKSDDVTNFQKSFRRGGGHTRKRRWKRKNGDGKKLGRFFWPKPKEKFTFEVVEFDFHNFAKQSLASKRIKF